MKLTDIRLQKFRSYTDSSYEIDKGVTIIVGPNAAGKTNLLEAIMLVSVGKTYRNSEKLIQYHQPWARIDAHTDSNTIRTIKLQGNTPLTKTIEIDNKAYKKLPNHLKLPLVYFEPNHLFLLHGEPQNRRSYLDNLIEETTPGFGKIRSDYKRSLLQRNRLLKNRTGDKSLVFAWNIKLAENAAKIVEARLALLKTMNKTIKATYSRLSDKDNKIILTYESTLPPENYAATLLKKLESSYDLDLSRGFTGYGPHRDDFSCFLKGSRIEQTGSRGEIRTLLLALKMIELSILEKATNQKPLLLLDDVFSELDGAHRRDLVGILKDHQTIITTTDADIVTKNFSQKCLVIPLV